jgi:hypothetical protein
MALTQATLSLILAAIVKIMVTGNRSATVDGGSQSTGNCFSITASYFTLSGITLQNCKKGVVTDNSNYVVLSSLLVQNIGEEAIHLRTFSSNNSVSMNTITNTGTVTPGFGEGVYIGSAQSNWATYTAGNPDTSNNNSITSNNISSTRAEPIDIKEGTTGTIVTANTLDGNLLSNANAADSLIDVKGNLSRIQANIFRNTGASSILDAIQIHVPVATWGANNIFSGNNLQSNIPGYGIRLDTTALTSGNVIYCSNVFTNALSGAQNTSCQ